jgi:ribonucleases P/MRP protein subunit RPP40
LGIQVTKNLKWSGQSTKAANKAMAALGNGMIKWASGSLDKDMYKLNYGSFVQPHLEYRVQAWSHYNKKDTLQLEKVQRRATKMVKGLGKLDYEERQAESVQTRKKEIQTRHD